jgi:hypothetical protein
MVFYRVLRDLQKNMEIDSPFLDLWRSNGERIILGPDL